MRESLRRHENSEKDSNLGEKEKAFKNKEKEQAKRQLLRTNQNELTENIKEVYSSIRPTIIQAQRILKIIEKLKEKFFICKYLNYEFIKNFEGSTALKESELDLDLVAKLSPASKKLLSQIAKTQRRIFELLSEDYKPVVEYGEGEEEYSRNEEMYDIGDDKLDENEDLIKKQKEEEERKNRAIQVNKLREEELAGDFNNLVRHLDRFENDFEIIKMLNTKGNEKEQYSDAYDTMDSIHMIFLKKLSTGFDEDYSHKKMLEDLKNTIESYQTQVKSMREELNKLIQDKNKFSENQKNEIDNLQAQIAKVKRDCERKKAELEAKERKAIEDETNKHKEKSQNLDSQISDIRKGLTELEAKSKESEKNSLNTFTANHNKCVDRLKAAYDEALMTETNILTEKKAEYEEVHKEMMELTDEYRRIMHEKEVNKAIETEWSAKLQKFSMHEDRKTSSAKFMVAMWKNWKENKKKGKKRRKSPKK